MNWIIAKIWIQIPFQGKNWTKQNKILKQVNLNQVHEGKKKHIFTKSNQTTEGGFFTQNDDERLQNNLTSKSLLFLERVSCWNAENAEGISLQGAKAGSN